MNERISLAHGDGGELAHQLIQEVFVKYFGNHQHSKLDSAFLSLSSTNIAVSTDNFVIKPIFFNGGNIGKLAIAGTVNDIAVSGATPKYITVGFIIEEGFSINDLTKIIKSMAEEAKHAGVEIVSGDTKVVERGSVDGIYINTTGIGIFEHEIVDPNNIEVGDTIIINGSVGDHGVAILASRGDLEIINDIQSDCSSLNEMIAAVLKVGCRVKIMRDPTRGGLATSLVEICEDFNVSMEIVESQIPIKKEVKGTCDLLGFEPIYLANEGKVIIIVDKEDEARVLDILQSFEIGKEAKVIGKVLSKDKGQLLLKTAIGSSRRLNRLTGLMLPRIC